MIDDERKARLDEAMAGKGLDVLLVYGNAWQCDYLRYISGYGILEGQGLALAERDGRVTLYLDSPRSIGRGSKRPAPRSSMRPTVGEVEAALERIGNRQVGAAPLAFLPRKLASSDAGRRLRERRNSSTTS